MAKAETQGWESLAAAERDELQTLLSRMDGLTASPLHKDAKETLRREARTLFYQQLRPDLAAVLKDMGGKQYDIHHRIPLEYAHLVPLRDINARANLAAAAKPVHGRINNIWLRLRKATGTPTADEVAQVEEIVRKHFERWFNKVYDYSPKSAEQLAAAERGALDELASLLARMQ